MQYREPFEENKPRECGVMLSRFEREVALLAGAGNRSHGIREALHFWIRSHPHLKIVAFKEPE